MAAHHALVAALVRFMGQGFLEIGNEVQRLLHLAFKKGRQRPIRQAHARAHPVEVAVHPQGQLVQIVAHIGQPLGVLDHGIKVVAVDQQQLAAIDQRVARFFGHLNATKVVAHKAACELVMVARDVDHVAALARPAQQLLHYVVVGLRPVPFAAQLPAVNDVAHQVKVVAGVGLEKLNQGLGLAAGRTQVQVRNKYGSVMHPVLVDTDWRGPPKNQEASVRPAWSVVNLYD